MMKIVLMLLLLCWPFSGHRRYWQWQQQQPKRIQIRAGEWFTTPHYDDGYWVEYWLKGNPFRDGGWIKAEAGQTKPEGYIFSQYRWEWPGIGPNEKTWFIEGFPGKFPDKPKRREFIPSYDPFLPGTRFNL